MSKKIVFLFFALVLLLATLGASATPAASNPNIIGGIEVKVTGSIWVPDNYTTIGQAIHSASNGDTIRVRAGIYYEHVCVDKSVSLIGEDPKTTIIDANKTKYPIGSHAPNVTISGFTLRNSRTNYPNFMEPPFGYPCGILVWDFGCNISGNIITNNTEGVSLFAGGNTLSENNITLNGVAVVSYSCNNTLSGNHITNNTWSGINLFNSFNTLSGNNITNNLGSGVSLYYSCSNNTISGNNMANNGAGVSISHSCSNNTIYGNNLTNNYHGVELTLSSNNSIYHNNFVNNLQDQVIALGSVDAWDNGVEGNYWSDYVGIDHDQDGIGDSPHVIDAHGQHITDSYPLMGMFHCYNTSSGYNVNVISNSTIEDFQYFESNSTIKMYVSNSSVTQTFGFCRVCIPHALMNETYYVTIDGAEPHYVNYTLYDNDTHRWIYFSYKHSTLEIIIVPEFPSLIILPLFMIATLLTVIVYKRKHQTRNKKREV